MTSPVVGRLLAVSVSSGSTDASYTAVAEVNSCDFTLGMQQADIAQFGDTAKRTMASGIVEFSGSLKGHNTPGDAGQIIVNAAALDGSVHFLKVLPDGATGSKCAVVFKPMKIGAKQGTEAQSWDIEFEPGAGVAAVPATA